VTNTIEAKELTRYYGTKRGVRDLDLEVPEGSILGLLGENGSGKTTALKLAMGMLVPDRGEVRTLGIDPVRMAPPVRARIGWLSDALAVPARMSLTEAMALQQAYFPTWDQAIALEIAQQFDFTGQSVCTHTPTQRYSSGNAILERKAAKRSDICSLYSSLTLHLKSVFDRCSRYTTGAEK